MTRVPLVLLLMLATGIGLHAQAGARRPEVAVRLLGSWAGTGVVTGRASTITMTWADDMGGSFLHLRFRNVMAPNATRPEDVFEGRGYYRVVGATATAGTGTWIDSRGAIMPLTVAVTADAFTTEWGSAATESGRTVYRVTGPDTMEVRDFVRAPDGQMREFGLSTFRRVR